MLWELIKTMRPHQWVKNSFVLAPLVFSQNLSNVDLVWRSALAVLLFCLASGAVYVINDLADVERDRAHPIKRFRPIPSGRLPLKAAKFAAVGLVVGSTGLSLLLEPWLAAILAGYMVLNLWYSFQLKHVVFLDVTAIATGFLLRVLAGGIAIDVPISVWLIVCTFLLSLYLALGKRKHEILAMGAGQKSRKVLEQYKLDHVRWAMWVASSVTAVCYLAYTLDPATIDTFETHLLPITVPFIGVGLWRFYRLTQSPEFGSPTELMLKDRPFIANILVWGVVTLALIYL